MGCCIIYLRIRFLKSSSVIPHSCFIPRSEAEIYWLIFFSLPDWIISIIMTFYIFLIAGKFDLIWSYFLIHSLISSCLSWKSLGNRSCPWQTKSQKCQVWFQHCTTHVKTVKWKEYFLVQYSEHRKFDNMITIIICWITLMS